MKSTPVVIERSYNAPVSKVWKALTDNKEMRQWYFDLETFKPEIGFEFRFMGGREDRQYLHICEVTESVFEKKLTYSWKYDGYEGISFVSFELTEDNNQTHLKLTHSGLESFPSSNPDFAAHNFVEGWTMILGTSLKNYLESN